MLLFRIGGFFNHREADFCAPNIIIFRHGDFGYIANNLGKLPYIRYILRKMRGVL